MAEHTTVPELAVLRGADRLPDIDALRLRLRWLTVSDVPALYEIFGDAEVCRFWSRRPLQHEAEAAALHEEIVELFRKRTLLQWGVAERVTDEIVGTCTLASLSAEHRRAEIGFAFARSAWGRGYASETVGALLQFAFDTLGLHRIEADVDPRNSASIRVLEKARFQREGYLRERYQLGGEAQDAVFYGLLRSEWRSAAGPLPGTQARR